LKLLLFGTLVVDVRIVFIFLDEALSQAYVDFNLLFAVDIGPARLLVEVEVFIVRLNFFLRAEQLRYFLDRVFTHG